MSRLAICVFVSGAALMGLEIVGSRVLAPVYGTSILVWGALITTFLVSLACGYALGGRAADRRPRPEALADVLGLSGALLWILCFSPARVFALAEALPLPERFRPLPAALFLFGPPSILMGMATPFAIRLATRDLSTVGRSAGRLSAISTAGSILGTFATAFFLIPRFSTRPILFGLGAALVGAAGLLAARSIPRVVAAALLASLGAGAYLVAPEPVDASPSGRVLLEKETAYHHIRVSEEGRFRILSFGHLAQGRTPSDAAEPMPATYNDGLLAALALPRTRPREVTLIGLGAGVVPRLLGPTGVALTSLEIDPEVVSIAGRFFAFQPGPRSRVLVGDGRRLLEQEVRSTDAVLLDAYFDDSVPFHLLTREFVSLVKERVGSDGVFAANLVGALCGTDDALFWAAHRTVSSVFPRVYVLSPELRAGRRPFRGNAILLATASTIALDPATIAAKTRALADAWGRPAIAEWGAEVYDGELFTNGVPILTDEYGPTDALQHFWR